MAVQAGGEIVLVGGTNLGDARNVATLIRLASDGSIDPTFRATLPNQLSRSHEQLNSVAIGTDGRITVGGFTDEGPFRFSLVERFLANGAVDTSFGINGRNRIPNDPNPPSSSSTETSASTVTPPDRFVNSVAVTADNGVIVAGRAGMFTEIFLNGSILVGPSQNYIARVLPVNTVKATPEDFSGDGRADRAIVGNGGFNFFGYLDSGSGGVDIAEFGSAEVNQSIPAVGDYDGDGRADRAVYLPRFGVYAYRPSTLGPDVLVSFGIPGDGMSIPAPGDYDGDGRTDLAIYLPTLAAFASRPSSGGDDVITAFGAVGFGQSIAVAGDYDGDGRTDLAVYLPTIGALAYRPSSGGADVFAGFGFAGLGNTIPAPGDYDGDGRTDVAAFLPTLGIYAYRPSRGAADVLVLFGRAGIGATIPVPADYDCDGRTDLAVYLTGQDEIGQAIYAYRPSAGGSDVLTRFGPSGVLSSLPVFAVPFFQIATLGNVTTQSVVVAMSIPLTDELLPPPGTSTLKSRAKRT